MADTKISALAELAAEPAADDEFVLVDKSDTTMAASGTDKRMRYDRISGLWLPRTASKFVPHRRSGAKVESVPRIFAGTAVTLTTQIAQLVLCHEPLRGGVTYSSITFESGGASGSALTNQWFAIVKASDFTVLRATVDDLTTGWGSNAEKSLNLSSTYTPSVDTEIYLAIMVKATTPPNVRNYALQSSSTFAGRAPILCGTGATGQTTPPADGTDLRQAGVLTATTNVFFGYIS